MTSIAAWLLTLCGISLVGMGGFFVVGRPPLLPEDARFMSSTTADIYGAVPGLGSWLRHVFWVLGGYIATTGFLVLYVANTGLRSDSAAALAVLAVAGLTSLGWMCVVNFRLQVGAAMPRTRVGIGAPAGRGRPMNHETVGRSSDISSAVIHRGAVGGVNVPRADPAATLDSSPWQSPDCDPAEHHHRDRRKPEEPSERQQQGPGLIKA